MPATGHSALLGEAPQTQNHDLLKMGNYWSQNINAKFVFNLKWNSPFLYALRKECNFSTIYLHLCGSLKWKSYRRPKLVAWSIVFKRVSNLSKFSDIITYLGHECQSDVFRHCKFSFSLSMSSALLFWPISCYREIKSNWILWFSPSLVMYRP